MSARTARLEYLQAMAEFERACLRFSIGMGAILEPPQPARETEATTLAILSELGPRKPAKRALREQDASDGTLDRSG
jgi:hypothetical protein